MERVPDLTPATVDQAMRAMFGSAGSWPAPGSKSRCSTWSICGPRNSTAAPTISAFLLGKLDPANPIISALIVFTMTSVLYRQVWKGSETIKRLEAA